MPEDVARGKLLEPERFFPFTVGDNAFLLSEPTLLLLPISVPHPQEAAASFANSPLI